jgi:hypothetical protein
MSPAASAPMSVTDELARSVLLTVPAAVDELHLAAVLESRGITDQTAREQFGSDDVFHLGAELRSRMPARPADPETPPRDIASAARALAHGPLYLVPTVVYPAVWTVLGSRPTIYGLLFATALSWVWGMATSAVAYQLLGQSRHRSAARALAGLTAAGLGLAGLGGGVLVRLGLGGRGMVAFILGLVAFQLASGILVFYRQERRLAVAMVPALVTGILYLTARGAGTYLQPALIAAATTTSLVLLAAALALRRAVRRPEHDAPLNRRAVLFGAVPSVAYAVLCAAFMLHTDARFTTGRSDLAMAAAPLVVGMGAVEWRAYRFTEAVDQLLNRSRVAVQFRHGAWRLMLRELALCLVILGALSTPVLLVLQHLGLLSLSGLELIEAHVLLGGGFFLGFVLARHQQFPILLLLFATVAAADIGAVAWATRTHALGVRAEVPLFLASTLALLVVLTIAFRTSLRRVFNYR